MCSIEKPRAGGPEHPDHILCRRRFAVPAGVEVISFPIWNPMAFQSIVLRFSVYVPPFPSRSSHDSPRKGGLANPTTMYHSSSFSMEWESQCSSSTIHSPFRKSSLVSDIKIYPSRWSSLHCGFAAGSLQYRSPILETTMRGQDLSSYMGVVGLAGAA